MMMQMQRTPLRKTEARMMGATRRRCTRTTATMTKARAGVRRAMRKMSTLKKAALLRAMWERTQHATVCDTFRKRRALTDMANAAFAAAYNPNQHLGLDEATRATKHWEKKRIRFKAAVHSGTLVDMLNDCKTNYCLWFEEQTWRSKKIFGDEVRSVTARMKLAAQVLVDKAKDANGRSTANYCISLDRGNGHIEAQHELDRMGVYTSAMIQANRKGLPRKFIAEVAKDLRDCPSKCSHKPEVEDCRRYR